MSKEQAQAFVERMKSDQAFAERVLAARDAEQRLAFIRAEGYDCSAGELAAEGGRLAEEALETLSAGHGCGFEYLPPGWNG